MKKYLIRSVKYLVALCVLYVALMAFMHHYNNPFGLTIEQRMQLMFDTWRGCGMVIATFVLATTYPFFGYVKRTFEGDIVKDREQLNRAADFVGLELVSESGEELVYHAKGLRRLVMLFEDTVRVRQCGSQIEVEGLRRIAVRMAFDAERYITNKRRDEA
jgi:hypothetical protein